jgi:hypothetical protein
MKIIQLLSISIALFSGSLISDRLCAAEIKNYEVYEKKFSLGVPKKWKVVQKKIAIPFKVIGPLYKERRAVVTVVPIDLNGRKIELKSKEKALESYKVGRLAWLQKFNGQLISFQSLKSSKKKNKDIKNFGYSYRFNGVNYQEDSYYIQCKEEAFHLKVLTQLEHLNKWKKKTDEVVDSFKCL